MIAFQGTDSPRPAFEAHGEVVEIALLLPTNRAEALMALSRQRRQTVAQILRGLIDRAIAGEEN